MEFKNQYLTYEEYSKLGGTLEKMPFNVLEFNARMEIDKRTFGRLIDYTPVPQEVKLCVYNLIAILNSYSSYASQNKNVASESIDGYSISYGTISDITEKAKNKEIESNIDSYLANTIVNDVPVLYRGVGC